MLPDQPEDRPRLDPAQADVGARVRRHAPREAPAVAVKHRQRPQVDGLPRHVPGEEVAHAVQIGAAVRVDDAFRIAGGARGVVERDRLPLVGRRAPRVGRIPFAEKRLVVDAPQPIPRAGVLGVVDVDHDRFRRRLLECGGDGAGELAIGDERLRLAVVQHERDRVGVEPGVERVEHRSGHRHAEVTFVHLRGVGEHRRDRVAGADPALGERGGEPDAAGVGFLPGVPPGTVDDRRAVRVHRRAPLDERQRRERRVVGRVPIEVGFVGIGPSHGAPPAQVYVRPGPAPAPRPASLSFPSRSIRAGARARRARPRWPAGR